MRLAPRRTPSKVGKAAELNNRWAEELTEGPDLEAGLQAVLTCALELSNTARGNIQLMNWKLGHLTIAVQRGFDQEFLDFFKYVRPFDDSACGRAVKLHTQIVVDDMV